MPPLFGRQTARLDVVSAQSRLSDNQTHHQLYGGHFEREERHALLVIDRHVAGHREHERRLAHRRACGDDDQVRELPAQRHAVDGHEARRHAVEGARILRRLLDLHQRAGQNILRRLHRPLDVSFGHLEYLALGISDQLRHVGRFVVRPLLNLGRRADQLALHVLLGDDLGVEFDVGGRTDLLRQLRQIRCTAHLLQLLLGLEPLGDGIEVDRFQLHRKLLDRAVDRAVLLGVKSVGRDVLLHGDDAVLFQHQRAEHGFLQFDRLRGHVAGGVGQRLECLPVALGGVIIFSHDLCFRSKPKNSDSGGENKTAAAKMLSKIVLMTRFSRRQSPQQGITPC